MDRKLLTLVKYHGRANEWILNAATALSGEELHRPGVLDHGSAFDTLRHLMDVDWSWREELAGKDVGPSYVWDHGFKLDDLESIQAFCREEDARLQRFVEGLDEAALERPLTVLPKVGPTWLVIAHVVNHGTQHRSELARYFTECGHSPGDFDLIDAYSST